MVPKEDQVANVAEDPKNVRERAKKQIANKTTKGKKRKSGEGDGSPEPDENSRDPNDKPNETKATTETAAKRPRRDPKTETRSRGLAEVESIQDHRSSFDGTMEFLVRWQEPRTPDQWCNKSFFYHGRELDRILLKYLNRQRRQDSSRDRGIQK